MQLASSLLDFIAQKKDNRLVMDMKNYPHHTDMSEVGEALDYLRGKEYIKNMLNGNMALTASGQDVINAGGLKALRERERVEREAAHGANVAAVDAASSAKKSAGTSKFYAGVTVLCTVLTVFFTAYGACNKSTSGDDADSTKKSGASKEAQQEHETRTDSFRQLSDTLK